MVRRLLPWIGVALLVVAAVVTAGWGNGPTKAPPEPTPSARPTEAASPLSAAEANRVVRKAALTANDLPRGFHRESDSYRLTDPSLDLCGGSFDSEGFRLAAHRVVFRAPGDRGRVASVVVAYQHGYAEQALSELESAAPRCTRPVKPSSREQPDLLALRLRATGPGGVVRHDLVVERRGDVLLLLEVDGRQGYLTLALARRLGNRLEAEQPIS